MREIKFRAWDKKRKEMLHYNGIFNSPDIRFDTSILMQYTGLVVNGVEVYEGDIVEYEPLSSHGAPFNKMRNKVKYIGAEFEIVPFEDKRWGGYQNLRVIGNIWENPNLLKERKK